jgi:hypothetical protein
MRTFPVNGAKRIPIDQIDDLDSDQAASYVKARRPFVARVKNWGALQWTVDYWRHEIGHKKRAMKRVADGVRFDVTISELLDIVQDPGWKSRVVPALSAGGPLFRIRRWTGYDAETEELWKDIVAPRWMPETHACTVLYRNSARGPEDVYYHTPCHWEDTALASLNMQVRGKKHVFLFSPDDAALMNFEAGLALPPHLSLGSDAFMHPDQFPAVKDLPCYEAILEPGDVVHWPEFWSHWFVHYPVEQINISFWWEPPDLMLNPLSATWAMSNALAHALGGFGECAERFAQLPKETQDLLIAMEQSLINRPELLRTSHVFQARISGGAILPIDHNAYAAPKKGA